MSRIGKNPVIIPDKVNLSINDKLMTAKGPLGELKMSLTDLIDVKIEDNKVVFSRDTDAKRVRSMHGTTRSLVYNMVEGVSKGWEKQLSIEGVGFKAEAKGDRLLLFLGFSHTILLIPPIGVSFEVINPTNFKVKGIDKQMVGEIAARIRKLRPPEPYKGKGIRYTGEYVRRKAGKTSSK